MVASSGTEHDIDATFGNYIQQKVEAISVELDLPCIE